MNVSFIIPVYNTSEERLFRCFESILGITELSYEVLIIDDGSEPSVGKFCKKYASAHDTFHYQYQCNSGVSSARNLGIDCSKGEFIYFVDSDDMIVPKSFRSYLLTLEADFIIFDIANCNERTSKTITLFELAGHINSKIALAKMFTGNSLNNTSARLIRRSLLTESRIKFNTGMVTAEDAEFVLNILSLSPCIYYVKEVSYLYWNTLDTGMKRILRYPEEVVQNSIDFADKKKKVLDEMECFSECEKEKYRNQIEKNELKSLFNYVTDLILMEKLNEKLKQIIQSEITKMKTLKNHKISFKLRMESLLLTYKFWGVIRIIAGIRRVYVKRLFRK